MRCGKLFMRLENNDWRIFCSLCASIVKSPAKLLMKLCQLTVDLVFARNYAPGLKWRSGSVVMLTRSISYKVKSTNCQSWNQHHGT
ncbi:hypothetical protein T4C_12811 [Trichinella pseudospiralis]|uniref:Uncharacterized protein n=1 Tax=Trichinella pseudospiralis TaxID=6337 RepID=A0A0V1JWG8_TRIPS|nr:hypothetical protein T4C_12811 [Trichinella pseudospiralis]